MSWYDDDLDLAPSSKRKGRQNAELKEPSLNRIISQTQVTKHPSQTIPIEYQWHEQESHVDTDTDSIKLTLLQPHTQTTNPKTHPWVRVYLVHVPYLFDIPNVVES